MTRVDFYQLDSNRYQAEQLVCKLCQKAYSAGQKVLLLTQNPQQTQQLDRLLWTHDDESFLPHDTSEPQELQTPVLINHQAEPGGDRELLINLSNEIPVYFAQFERVIELVTAENRDQARNHYSYYRDRGYELNHHKL